MRSDMNKVLVERPRATCPKDKRPWPRGDLESLPKQLGTGRFATKELSENFAPLLRYLRSKLGQRWDDVYSDVSRHLRPTNAVQQHVRVHLRQFVDLHVHFQSGEPRTITGHFVSFYVCPNTGILCEYQHARLDREWKVATKRGCRCKDCRRPVHW